MFVFPNTFNNIERGFGSIHVGYIKYGIYSRFSNSYMLFSNSLRENCEKKKMVTSQKSLQNCFFMGNDDCFQIEYPLWLVYYYFSIFEIKFSKKKKKIDDYDGIYK